MLGVALGALIVSTNHARAEQQAPASVAACAGCHSTGETADTPNMAKLAGLSETYLRKQLDDYRSGRRKSDVMTAMAAGLKSNELTPVAAHFANLKPAPEKGTDAALASRGRSLYEEGNPSKGVPNCVGCHGPNGGDSPDYPRLAGQVATYVVQEMGSFKSGARANDRARVMREIASRMTDDEIKAVAEYAASLPIGR